MNAFRVSVICESHMQRTQHARTNANHPKADNEDRFLVPHAALRDVGARHDWVPVGSPDAHTLSSRCPSPAISSSRDLDEVKVPC
jgi:hypothetical protein